MKNIQKKSVNTNKILIISIFISIYILPISYFRKINFNLDQYLFAFLIFIYFLNYIYKNKKIKIKDFVFVFLILYFIIINESITHAHLIGLIVIDKIILYKKEINNYVYNSKILFISFLFLLFYTIIYFGENNRYLFSAIKEVNQSGFAIIMLFIMIRIRNKKIGNLLLIIGLFLIYSRSYFLALIILYITEFIIKNRFIMKKIITKVMKNFLLVTVISIICLILLSLGFSNLYEENNLRKYETNITRIISFIDYSNYHRFIVNTNLLKIYKQKPLRLVKGINTEEFFKLNYEISLMEEQKYREIKPHNYFFSYLRIYGLFSIFIFWYLHTIIKKIIKTKNLPVFLVIFSYITFLGIGVNSYWLFLSVITMILYGTKDEEGDF